MEADQDKTPTVSLGADPEWAVVNADGEIVRSMTLRESPSGVVGWDHSGYVREIRPRPAALVTTLVRRVRELLAAANSIEGLRRSRWTAVPFVKGCGERGYVTCGGHVHVGLQSPGLNNGLNGFDTFFVAMNQLYEAFTLAGLWSAALCGCRQKISKYGHTEDLLKIRRRGLPTVEYRGFPTWLNHPWTATAVLTASKVVANDPRTIRTLTPTWKGVCQWFETVAPRFAGSLPETPPGWDKDIREAWEL